MDDPRIPLSQSANSQLLVTSLSHITFYSEHIEHVHFSLVLHPEPQAKRPTTVIGYYRWGAANEPEKVAGGAAYQPLSEMEGMRLLPPRGAAQLQSSAHPLNNDVATRSRNTQAAHVPVPPNIVTDDQFDDDLSRVLFITTSFAGRANSQPVQQQFVAGAVANPDFASGYSSASAFASASASASASATASVSASCSSAMRRGSYPSGSAGAGGFRPVTGPGLPEPDRTRSARHLLHSHAPESTSTSCVQSLIESTPKLNIKRLLSVYGTLVSDAPGKILL